MKISARTPNRIDLAGGTLDIYPLYVFLEGGYTLNAAIDLYSQVDLTPREDEDFYFESVDFGTELKVSRADLLAGRADHSDFRLLVQGVKAYLPAQGLNIRSFNQAPKGSGLGASSALLIALSGALNQWNAVYPEGNHLIQRAADLEAWVLGIPTGKQDYYAALYGGLQAIHFDQSGIEREHITLPPEVLERLNGGLVLSFTGESHFSGTNNWSMMKRFIDDSGQTRDSLRAIRDTSQALYQALQQADLEQVYALLNQEWKNRQALAEGVTTPQIDTMIAAASEAGALANKICGAGGGGCLLTLCDPQDRTAVEAALSSTGAQVMRHQITRQGLQVNVLD